MEAGDSEKQESEGDWGETKMRRKLSLKGVDSERRTESRDPESDNDGNSKYKIIYTDSRENYIESESSEEEEIGTDEEGDVDTDYYSDVDGKDDVEEKDETSQKKELNVRREGISEGGVEAGHSIVSTSSKTIPSVPPCTRPPVCLYNQSGKLCRALGERCILTEFNAGPVFVGTRMEECEWGPVGVGLVWCSGRPFSLDQVPDGAEVCFDAVILPGTSKFIALVVWQDTKPTISTEPYFNSYVLVDEFENIKVNFVSFEGDSGVVRATIQDKEQLVEFSNSVVFKNGQKVESKEEIDDLCGSGCGELFANVYMLVTVDGSDQTSCQYGFMCSCLWSEMKPQNTGITSRFDKFTLYQKVGSYYSDGKEQLYMHCDAQSELVLSDSGCKLTYKNNNQEIIDILCEEESFYCDNQRVSPVRGGQVKAHLRRTIDTDGKERWSAVMVQLPHSLIQTTTTAPPHAEDSYTSKVFKNVKGVLQWNEDQKKFVITTDFGSPLPELLVVGDRAKLVLDNELTDFNDQTAFDSVQFDVYYEKLRPVILSTWKSLSHKPHVVYNKNKTNTYFYDVPGFYRGKAKNKKLKFDVVLDGEIRSIQAFRRRRAVFSPEGKVRNSIPVMSRVTLHLRETIKVDGKSIWKAYLVIVNTGQNDATNSESNAEAPVAGDSSDTCSNLTKCNNKHLTKMPNDNQRPKSNQTSKILKNCQGTLYWYKPLKLFKIATQTKGLPSEILVGSRSYCAQDGKVTDLIIDCEDEKINFDCYVDGNDKFHILSIWKGTKPAVARNKNGSYKYYYDVAGVYRGVIKNLMMFDVTLNGQLRSITTNNTEKVVFSEEGQHCASIPVSSQVVLHLKEYCNQKECPWLAMVVVVEKVPTELPSQQKPKPNEGERQGVARKPITKTNIIWQSDSVERDDNSHIEEIQTSEVLKNCHGTLYWNWNVEHFIIATKINGIPFEVNIGKQAFYVSNGRVMEVNDKVSNIPVQFDAHFSTGNTKLHILAIWQGNKPQSAINMSKRRRYYYDMPGVYRGQSKNNLLVFDIIVDGQIKSITTEHTNAVYTAEGYRCKSVPLSSQVSLHLMEPCKVKSPWLASLVIVKEQCHPSDSSLLALAKDSYLRTQGGMASASVKDSNPHTESGVTSIHIKDSYSRTRGGMMSTYVQDSNLRTQDGVSSTHVRDLNPKTQGSMASALAQDFISRTQDNMTPAHDRDFYSIAQDRFAYTDRVPTSNIPDDDSMWLCPETLKQYLSSGSLEELSMKHCRSHPVYRGQVEDLPGGKSVFRCSRSFVPSPLTVSDIPQYRWRKSSTSGNTYCLLLTQYKIPLFMWPEGASCDPYIITANRPVLHDENKKLLGFEIGGKVVIYSYGYDMAFTRKCKKSINVFFHNIETTMFAVVENLPPMDVDGYLVEGEILFLCSSLHVALAGISTMIGNEVGQNKIFRIGKKTK